MLGAAQVLGHDPHCRHRVALRHGFERGHPALAVVRHLLTYPLEVLGCTAPWSFLLIAFSSARFRGTLGGTTPVIQFLTIAAAVWEGRRYAEDNADVDLSLDAGEAMHQGNVAEGVGGTLGKLGVIVLDQAL